MGCLFLEIQGLSFQLDLNDAVVGLFVDIYSRPLLESHVAPLNSTLVGVLASVQVHMLL